MILLCFVLLSFEFFTKYKYELDERTCQKLARVEIRQSDSLLNLLYSEMYPQLLQV